MVSSWPSLLHVDALSTSAWDTLVLGRKQWVVFPPENNVDVVDEALVNLTALTPHQESMTRANPPLSNSLWTSSPRFATN